MTLGRSNHRSVREPDSGYLHFMFLQKVYRNGQEKRSTEKETFLTFFKAPASRICSRPDGDSLAATATAKAAAA